MWSCFDLDMPGIIASHLVAGKLVLRYEPSDGEEADFHVLTPGNEAVIPLASIRF